MSKKKALVLGATGQDGSLISKSLLEKGHKVVAISRGTSKSCEKLKNFISRLTLYRGGSIRLK